MKAIVEGLLFVCGDDGLTIEEICNITEKDTNTIKNIIKELYNDYQNENRGIQLEYLGNHYKLTTKSEHKKFYKKMIDNEVNSNLGQSALETLAIIAYNQPLTRLDIDNIRGTNSSYVVRKLLLMGFIEDVGRSDSAGRPKLYSVTSKFLDYFGLGSIEELPELKENEDDSDDETNLFESKYKEIQ